MRFKQNTTYTARSLSLNVEFFAFLRYNYSKRMARFCACVSQVLTKMFGAFAFLCVALKTVYALSFA